MAARTRFDWRFLPLLLVLLTCNAETRQAVTQTIHYLVSSVCLEPGCAAQTTQGQSPEPLELTLPAQSGVGLLPDPAGLSLALTFTALVLFRAVNRPRRRAAWADSRAPPRRFAWPTP